MLVPVTVILHRAFLGEFFRLVERDPIFAVFVGNRADDAKLDRIECLSHVTAAGIGNMPYRCVFDADFDIFLFFKNSKASFYRRDNIFGGDAFEFKNRRTA